MTQRGFDRAKPGVDTDPRTRRAGNADAGQQSVFNQIGIGIPDATATTPLHIQKGHEVNLRVDRIQSTEFGPAIQLRKSRGDTDDLQAVTSGDYCGLIAGFAYVGDTNQFLKGPSIEFLVDGSVSDSGSGNFPGSLRFRTRNSSGGTPTVCWMDAEGKVGIGDVDDPDQQLEVKGSIHISGEEDLGSVSVANGDGGLLYVKSDGKLYWKSNELAETDLTASGSGGEANEEAFQTISVSGQSNVVADADADTLTLVAGTNVTITTDAAADSITFAATDTNTQLSTEQVQDIVGAMFTSNTETRISATYEDGDGTIDLVVDDMTADTQLTTEQVQDIVGAMFSGNTETRITATYEDGDGTIDLVVDDMTADTQLTTEAVQDIVGAMFTSNTETRCTVTYQDADGTIDVVVDDLDTNLTTEAVQDIVGAMFTSNTETRISATYQDGDGTIDLVVDDMTANTQLTQEQVEDYAGALVASGGTKTGISVTYQDGTGDMDFVVDLEGTELKSTGETGGSKFLREDGDGTCSWQTVSGGSGSGDVEAGSTFTTAGVIMACDGDDKTIDEPNALLTTNGQGMTVSAALATPFQVDSGARDGNSTFKFTTGSGSGTNNQASIQVIAQTAANANLYLGDTASATRGGLTYKNNGDSLQLKAAGAVVLELDSDKVVEFKIAEETDSGSDYSYASKVLKIKVNGTDYYLPLYAEAGGGGMGGP